MADSTFTINPDTVICNGCSGSAAWTPSSGQTVLSAITDTTDSTNISYTTSGAANEVQIGFSTATILSSNYYKTLTMTIRASTGSGTGGFMAQMRLASGAVLGGTIYIAPGTMAGAFTDYQTVFQLSSGSLQQADLDGLYISFSALTYGGFAAPIYVTKASITVTYNAAPTIAFTSPPSSSTTTSNPPVTWTLTDTEGDTQERYQLKVFDSYTATSGGFNPETSTALYDSGEVFTASTSTTLPVGLLQNNSSYYFYIKVAQNSVPGWYSPWYSTVGQIALAAVSAPILSATPQDSQGRVQLTVQTRDNLLTDAQASMESAGSIGTADWSAGTNTTLTLYGSGTGLPDGAGNIGIKSIAAGTISGSINSAVKIPVVNSTAYTALVDLLMAGATGRACTLTINWFTGTTGSSVSSVRASDTSASVTPNNTKWRPISLVVTSPSDATFATLTVTMTGATAANEELYIDAAVMVPGPINMMSAAKSTFESFSDSGWTQFSNMATLTSYNDNLHVTQGTLSGVIQAAGAGTVQMQSNSDVGLNYDILVAPGFSYTFMVYALAAATGRTIQLNVTWRDISKASLSTTSAVASTADTTTGFTRISGQATAPANAFYAVLQIQVLSAAANEIHYVDQAAVMPGTWTTWTSGPPFLRGGLYSYQRIVIERSVDGGATWTTVRGWVDTGSGFSFTDYKTLGVTAVANSLVVYDYEAPRGKTVIYRAYENVNRSSTYNVNSARSNWVSVVTSRTAGCAWVKHPTHPEWNAIVVLDQHEIVKTRTQVQGQHYAYGRDTPYIVYGTTRKSSFPVKMFFLNDTTYRNWLNMQDGKTPLLLQTNFGDQYPEEYWFTLDPDIQTTVLTTDDMTSATKRYVEFAAREAATP